MAALLSTIASLPGVDTVVAAHAAMMESSFDMPMKERCFAAAICSLTAFVACGLFHALVARRFKRQYFCLHVFANTVITRGSHSVHRAVCTQALHATDR